MSPEDLIRQQGAITPFLFLGYASEPLTDVMWVHTAEEAYQIIMVERKTAVLPQGAWAEAEKALHLMSPDRPDLVARAMKFAQTGRLD